MGKYKQSFMITNLQRVRDYSVYSTLFVRDRQTNEYRVFDYAIGEYLGYRGGLDASASVLETNVRRNGRLITGSGQFRSLALAWLIPAVAHSRYQPDGEPYTVTRDATLEIVNLGYFSLYEGSQEVLRTPLSSELVDRVVQPLLSPDGREENVVVWKQTIYTSDVPFMVVGSDASVCGILSWPSGVGPKFGRRDVVVPMQFRLTGQRRDSVGGCVE